MLKSVTGNNQSNNKKSPQPTGARNVSVEDTTTINCSNDDCNSETFVQAARFGRLSSVHPNNPTGKEKVVPFQTWVCSQCGTEIEV
jgi:hypothetical protein